MWYESIYIIPINKTDWYLSIYKYICLYFSWYICTYNSHLTQVQNSFVVYIYIASLPWYKLLYSSINLQSILKTMFFERLKIKSYDSCPHVMYMLYAAHLFIQIRPSILHYDDNLKLAVYQWNSVVMCACWKISFAKNLLLVKIICNDVTSNLRSYRKWWSF